MLFNKRTASILCLGFFSGLPLLLSSSTLQAWFTVKGESLLAVGALTLVGLPYLVAFLWAPLLDRYLPPFLSRRRGWMVVAQGVMAILLLVMSQCDPAQHAMILASLAVALAFFSASQDIVINAYQTEILEERERGLGASFFVIAYRVGLFVSGGLALVFANYMGWAWTYRCLSFLMLLGILVTIFTPSEQASTQRPKSLFEAVVLPWSEFLKRRNALSFILFIVLYKFGDAFGLSLTTFFLLGVKHFSLVQVGFSYKLTAILATLLGTLVGGLLMARIGLLRALVFFGVLQSLALLPFAVLANPAIESVSLMFSALFLEFFTSGLSTVAFLAFLMGLCHLRYTATQFALFTALASIGRVALGPVAALVVMPLGGWQHFYTFSVFLMAPWLVVLFMLHRKNHFTKTGLQPREFPMSDEVSRLRWQCRRGMLELDLILIRFLEQAYPRLSLQEQHTFQELLSESDPRLWAWLSGEGVPDRQGFHELILKMRGFHGEN